MEALSKQLPQASLKAEWERIEWLAWLALCSRRGQEAGEKDTARLRELQARVSTIRQTDRVWGSMGFPDLAELEMDVIACVVAPEMEPRVASMYRELQPSSSSPYPTASLIQEMLALDADWLAPLYEVLGRHGALHRYKMLRSRDTGHFEAILPADGLAMRLSGGDSTSPPPPGATLVQVQAGWDDLILPADRITMLREFLLWIRQQHVVVGQWGGKLTGGPIALFAGPSGTGKTFAAAVLAQELQWPLYRVDLGQLVSKYIGETEKNLNALFDAASGRPMVLQFDEADSLFGKRGEVKEARDRYANMGVSHLLARIESHHGPCILTTNLRKHLDNAFARRFQMVVDFPRPDAHDRTRLWKLLLPPHAPIGKDVDPIQLGRAINLSGGGIRNAALHAAYLAAGEGKAIQREHVALAVWRELAKDGREVMRRDLGELAADLPESVQ